MQVFSELHGDDWSSLNALRECIGDIQEDRTNAIMEAEMASQRGDSDTGEVSNHVQPCLLLFSFLAFCCHSIKVVTSMYVEALFPLGLWSFSRSYSRSLSFLPSTLPLLCLIVMTDIHD